MRTGARTCCGRRRLRRRRCGRRVHGGRRLAPGHPRGQHVRNLVRRVLPHAAVGRVALRRDAARPRDRIKRRCAERLKMAWRGLLCSHERSAVSPIHNEALTLECRAERSKAVFEMPARVMSKMLVVATMRHSIRWRACRMRTDSCVSAAHGGWLQSLIGRRRSGLTGLWGSRLEDAVQQALKAHHEVVDGVLAPLRGGAVWAAVDRSAGEPRPGHLRRVRDEVVRLRASCSHHNHTRSAPRVRWTSARTTQEYRATVNNPDGSLGSASFQRPTPRHGDHSSDLTFHERVLQSKPVPVRAHRGSGEQPQPEPKCMRSCVLPCALARCFCHVKSRNSDKLSARI